MLVNSSFQVGCDSGIECVIGTFQDINIVGHCVFHMLNVRQSRSFFVHTAIKNNICHYRNLLRCFLSNVKSDLLNLNGLLGLRE